MTTFNTSWIPDQGARRTMKPRILQAKFGDGYAQETGDGINNQLETWKLNFTHRAQSVVTAIDSFLTTAGGTSTFVWTTPRGLTGNFKCYSWETDDSTPQDSALTCEFVQFP